MNGSSFFPVSGFLFTPAFGLTGLTVPPEGFEGSEGLSGVSFGMIGRDDLKLSNGCILQFLQIERPDLRRSFLLIFCLDELKIRTIEQAAVFLVDEFGIVGDQAVLGLPEDLIENRHRYDAASNQLREHVARADALQLIDVAQQQEFRVLL